MIYPDSELLFFYDDFLIYASYTIGKCSIPNYPNNQWIPLMNHHTHHRILFDPLPIPPLFRNNRNCYFNFENLSISTVDLIRENDHSATAFDAFNDVYGLVFFSL